MVTTTFLFVTARLWDPMACLHAPNTCTYAHIRRRISQHRATRATIVDGTEDTIIPVSNWLVRCICKTVIYDINLYTYIQLTYGSTTILPILIIKNKE